MGISPFRWRNKSKVRNAGATDNETIAPREEYRNNATTMTQVIPDNIPIIQENPTITPKVVATPLPPLNLSQTGNMCPATTQNPAITAQSGP